MKSAYRFATTGCMALCLAAGARAADRDRVEDADFTKKVTITFSGTSATVVNEAGVTVTQGANSSDISINSTVDGVEYILSGTSTAGYVQITSTRDSKVTLNGVTLTSTSGPAISMLSTARNHVVLAKGTANTLSDSASYTRSGSAALYSTGPLILTGDGSLGITGLKSHGIYAGTYVRAMGGDVKVSGAVKDAVHANTFFQMDTGSLSVTASGDGIDADAGFIVINGGSITVKSTVNDTKGITCDGALTVNGGSLNLTVDGIQSKAMSSKGNITINRGTVAVNMAGAVYLETVTTTTGSYVDPSYSTAMKCDGNLTVNGGSIVVTHTGIAGKGISTKGNILVAGGTVDIATTGGTSASYTNEDGVADVAAADCMKADGTLTITAGTVSTSSTGVSGDCLSSDLALAITGGTVTTVVGGASGDCIASDQTVTISGGTIGVTAEGAQSKGIKSGAAMSISGGNLMFALSGAVVLESVATSRFDPSYCTAIKSGTDLSISSGTIAITHTGMAGKGISVDGNLTISGGTINVTNSGANSATFTNASGVTDMASADCIKADGNLTITGGTITAASTGNGGDAISCDGAAIIGLAGVSDTPVITASTTGAKVLLTGSGMSADYVNAKAFKAGGDLTMNGGIYRGSTQQDGGEGMESKANLTINGGLVEITSYDDCINATTKVTINGGMVYCYSSGNDGIDSNGTMLITGGTVISSGTNSPEEGFDCDQNNFTITGGTLVGTGGATSSPTASTSTQRSVIYKGAGTINTFIVIRSTGGNNLVYKIPRTYSGGGGGGGGGGGSSTPMTMLFSNSGLASGTTYSVVTGASVTGGTEFHGLYTGATVSGGTAAKTFNPTSMVTTVQ